MDERNNPRALDEARCWEALTVRERTADGTAAGETAPIFYYGVRTTCIYCRPGCKSRLPRRENVVFFATPAEAQAAGYRACKRCTPDVDADETPARTAARRALALIEAAEEAPTLAYLADAVGMSPFHFQRVFKRQVGLSPKDYFREVRAGRMRSLLVQEEHVGDVIYRAGFGSSRGFYEQAGEALGMRPADYRDGGAGQEIRYALNETSLGWVLVAATERGVCAVEFGDGPTALEGRLRARFPRAALGKDDDRFAGWVRSVLAYLEAPGRGIDLPLDLHGTAFQRRVWAALRQIPSGETASYAQVAERIGEPKAARAVAQACAANPVVGVVPCHRVVRADGSLGGYRYGAERKRALLEREKEKPDPDFEI